MLRSRVRIHGGRQAGPPILGFDCVAVGGERGASMPCAERESERKESVSHCVGVYVRARVVHVCVCTMLRVRVCARVCVPAQSERLGPRRARLLLPVDRLLNRSPNIDVQTREYPVQVCRSVLGTQFRTIHTIPNCIKIPGCCCSTRCSSHLPTTTHLHSIDSTGQLGA